MLPGSTQQTHNRRRSPLPRLALAALFAWTSAHAAGASTPPAGSDEGAKVYATVCAQCHEAGVPKAPSRSMLTYMAPGTIFKAITEGIMQAQARQLSVEQKVAVVSYLTGRDPTVAAKRPELPTCSGEAARFDVDHPPRLAGWGFSPDNRREIPNAVAGIDRGNVGRLVLQWVFAFPDELRARSGELAWNARPDQHPNATITGAPTLFEGRLYVPVSSLEVTAAAEPTYACCTFRGSVVAYDALSGERLWKTFTIPEPVTAREPNPHGVVQREPSGAPIWNSPAIDAKRRQLYVGTGENYSSPAGDTSDAILAIGLDKRELRWSFQATPGDAWNSACVVADRSNCPVEDGPDFDFGGAALLAAGADGRDLVMAGQKSGMVWALDPDSGELVWKQRAGRGGVIGGIHFGIAASGDRLIVPVADAIADPSYPDRYPGDPMPGLAALYIASGKILWRWDAVDACGGKPYCMPGNSAVPTATPELAIAGSLDGHLRIHDARSGEILWDYDTARDYPETLTGIPAGAARWKAVPPPCSTTACSTSIPVTCSTSTCPATCCWPSVSCRRRRPRESHRETASRQVVGLAARTMRPQPPATRLIKKMESA